MVFSTGERADDSSQSFLLLDRPRPRGGCPAALDPWVSGQTPRQVLLSLRFGRCSGHVILQTCQGAGDGSQSRVSVEEVFAPGGASASQQLGLGGPGPPASPQGQAHLEPVLSVAVSPLGCSLGSGGSPGIKRWGLCPPDPNPETQSQFLSPQRQGHPWGQDLQPSGRPCPTPRCQRKPGSRLLPAPAQPHLGQAALAPDCAMWPRGSGRGPSPGCCQGGLE